MVLEFLETVTSNAVLMGALMAVIFNVAGYIASMLKIKAFESYDLYKAAQTLALFEGIFIALQGIAGLEPKYVAIIAIIVNVIYSLKNVLPKPTE